ncbi:Ig-like domain-containing protein, partial [Rosenbergiella collisarenosi]|uniref:Ig-like domain-containing protein n=1 Tax=Rosenbergiella collisarenosi TaxID=1544695 RepID=UPI001F4F08C1
TATLSPAQTNGQSLSVTSTDTAGNASTPATVVAKDTTAPAAPTGVQVSGDGETVTGKAEAGSKVTIKDADGTTIGNTTVGSDGSFTATLSPAQTNGQTLSVISTDTAGNASTPVTVVAKDTTAPAAPTDVVVSDDGVTVTGKAEAGSTVAIKDAAGITLGSVKVAADGSFTATLSPAQTNGQTLSVTATDAANNPSSVATTTAPDTTAPAAPTVVQVSGDGETVTGKAEAGSTVTIKNTDGTTLGSAKVGADGSFTATLSPAQTNGQALSVISTDPAGNASTPVTVAAHDTTAPAQPNDVQVSSDGETVTGKAEAGSTVAIKDADGNTLGSATVAADGTFTATLSPAQTNGQALSVISTDNAGNTSTPVTVIAQDTTAPAQPSDVQLNDTGTTITGKGEVGSAVIVNDANGKELGSGSVGSDGTFSISLTRPQTNGETLDVISIDSAKNSSTPVTVTALDTTAPIKPSDVRLDDAGTTVSGKGEVGSIITITNESGKEIGSGIVASDGTFSIILTKPQTNG